MPHPLKSILKSTTIQEVKGLYSELWFVQWLVFTLSVGYV